MRRITYWAASTATALVLLFGYHTSTQGALSSAGPVAITGTAEPASGNTSGSSGSSGSTGTSGSSGSAGSTGSSGSSGTSGTRTVTGAVAQTEWGPVQVRLTLSGERITDVAVVQYPNGNPRDQEINSYALPILIQQTLDSQDAQVDMISGATITSDGYQQSLQSALDEVGL